MASLAVMNAVSAIVATNWPHTPIYALNDLAAPPADGAALLQIGYPARAEQPLSIGSGVKCYEETGAFVAVLSIPIGAGLNPAASPWATRIEALMAAFRGTYADGVEYLSFVGPTEGDDSDDGAYYTLSFSCAYRYLFSA